MKPALRRMSIFGLMFSLPLGLACAESGTVADQHNFAISLTGLYLNPTASNMTYAVHTEPLPAPAPSWTQQSVKPSFSPAFNLGLQYIFDDQVNSVSLDWLYLTTKDSASDSATGTASVAPTFYFGPGAQALRGSDASSTVRFDVSDVRLVFNHLFNIGDHIQLTPYAGLGVGYLKQEIDRKSVV